MVANQFVKQAIILALNETNILKSGFIETLNRYNSKFMFSN